MPIAISGKELTAEKLVDIARNKRKVELIPAALERIKTCRQMENKAGRLTSNLFFLYDIHLTPSPSSPETTAAAPAPGPPGRISALPRPAGSVPGP